MMFRPAEKALLALTARHCRTRRVLLSYLGEPFFEVSKTRLATFNCGPSLSSVLWISTSYNSN